MTLGMYKPDEVYAGYDFDVPEVLRANNGGYAARTWAPWAVDEVTLRGFALCGYDLQPIPPKRHWWQRPKRQRWRR